MGMQVRDEQNKQNGHDEEDKQDVQDKVASGTPENKGVCKTIEIHLKAKSLAQQLYQEKIRLPEIITQLSEDLELAEETVKEYVTYFHFERSSVLEALRMFLKVLWPEDEVDLQHLFIAQFAYQYVLCTGQDFKLQKPFYYLIWSLIILNADLNGGHKGRKMTREEFLENVNHVGRLFRFWYKHQDLECMYDSVKRTPLKACSVRTRGKDVTENKTLMQKIHKRGFLFRKINLEKNRRKRHV